MTTTASGVVVIRARCGSWSIPSMRELMRIPVFRRRFRHWLGFTNESRHIMGESVVPER